jgi:hypothetical protein
VRALLILNKAGDPLRGEDKQTPQRAGLTESRSHTLTPENSVPVAAYHVHSGCPSGSGLSLAAPFTVRVIQCFGGVEHALRIAGRFAATPQTVRIGLRKAGACSSGTAQTFLNRCFARAISAGAFFQQEP